MDFVESRLIGIQIDEAGREVSLLIIGKSKAKFTLELHGVERLLITEFRQQNVIEGLTHWRQGEARGDLREAAFILMTGVSEDVCDPRLAPIARDAADRVARGELEMMEIAAVFGAQILASFSSMTIRPEVR